MVWSLRENFFLPPMPAWNIIITTQLRNSCKHMTLLQVRTVRCQPIFWWRQQAKKKDFHSTRHLQYAQAESITMKDTKIFMWWFWKVCTQQRHFNSVSLHWKIRGVSEYTEKGNCNQYENLHEEMLVTSLQHHSPAAIVASGLVDVYAAIADRYVLVTVSMLLLTGRPRTGPIDAAAADR